MIYLKLLCSRVRHHPFKIGLRLFEACFASLGGMWLIIQIYSHFSGQCCKLPFWEFLTATFFVAIGVLVWDGLCGNGFLRNSEKIPNQVLGTGEIEICFGDIFAQEGWAVIGVSECFDSVVDDIIVAKKSLHGQMITRYFIDSVDEWDRQISETLKPNKPSSIKRENDRAKTFKHSIGTTAIVKKNDKKFLCVALTEVDRNTDKVSADEKHLTAAVKGALKRARECCSGDLVILPLMGAGVSGISMNANLILIHIVRAAIEECKSQKVTDLIRIVIHPSDIDKIDLSIIQKIWRP